MDFQLLMNHHPRALLVLADGSVFSGYSIGAEASVVGEVVFNTAMTGYQEVITDPSYAEQIVTMTCPHIGNVGVNSQDNESSNIWAKGLIIRELSPIVSNWRADKALPKFLKEKNLVAIAGVDTRRLTRHLRDKGAQNGCIVTDGSTAETAIARAKSYPGLKGLDLAKQVSRSAIESWSAGLINIHTGLPSQSTHHYKVVVYDFGVKHQILRLLVEQGCQLTIVPAQTPVETVLALKPNGVLLSNGPGDPDACHYAIEATKVLLEKNIPLFGICLGFQIMALACGAKTVKMKFGHHGVNHPVQCLSDKSVQITSQNHSFAVDISSLPSDLEVTHISLFDGSLQGFSHKKTRAFGFQGHPEGSPGPHDIRHLFQRFTALMGDANA